MKKKQEELEKFIRDLSPEIKSAISKIIAAEKEGQGRIKIKIRQIIEAEVQQRET